MVKNSNNGGVHQELHELDFTGVFQPLQPLIRAAIPLLEVVNVGMNARITTRYSKALLQSYAILFGSLEMISSVERFRNMPEEAQYGLIIIKRNDWNKIADKKVWRTFCGRTHPIPYAEIEAFRVELERLNVRIREIIQERAE